MDRGAWRASVHGLHDRACGYEGAGRRVGSHKFVELKKKKKKKNRNKEYHRGSKLEPRFYPNHPLRAARPDISAPLARTAPTGAGRRAGGRRLFYVG